jgi:hypothetical protein
MPEFLNTVYEFFINNLAPSLPGLLGVSNQLSAFLTSPITSLFG